MKITGKSWRAHARWTDVAALGLCMVAAIGVQLPLLRDPYWLILDDPTDIQHVIRPLLDAPGLTTILASDAPSRFRPVHWMLRSLIYGIGGGRPIAFWHANWIILSASLFLAYAICRNLCTRRLAALVAPVIILGSPPLIEIQYASSAQERWLLLFGLLFVYALVRTERALAGPVGALKRWRITAGSWIAGVLYLYCKEPAMIGLFFPLLWWAFSPARTGDEAPRRRRNFLLGTSLFMLLMAAGPMLVRVVANWTASGEGYSKAFVLSWEKIRATHAFYLERFFPRVWLILLLPVLAAVATGLRERAVRLRLLQSHGKPILFFLLIALLQYSVRLPWVPQTRYLFPLMGPLAIIGALALDCALVPPPPPPRAPRPAEEKKIKE